MDGGLAMIMVMTILAANAARRDRESGDDPGAAKRREKYRAVAVIVAAVGALIYAAGAAALAVTLLLALAFGSEPWTPGVFLMVPGLAAASAFLLWVGTRLLRDKDLPARLARACSAAVEALCEPTPGGGKPKPARHDHELD